VIRLTSVSLVVRRWICAIHLALIAVLSLAPAWLFPPSPPGLPGIDKAVHVGLYGILGALLRWAAGPWAATRAALALPAAGALYGLLLELLQPWLGGAGRAFSWADAAANLAGIVLFWVVAGRFLGRENSSFR
jgi:VanZ family protein